MALEAQFKKLSLEQAQNEAQLKSDTALAQETIKGENNVTAKGTVAPKQAEPPEEPVNIDEALSMLGLQ